MAGPVAQVELPFRPSGAELVAHCSETYIEHAVRRRVEPLRAELQAKYQHQREVLLAEVEGLKRAVAALGQAAAELVRARGRTLEQAATLALWLTERLAHRLLADTLEHDWAFIVRLVRQVLEQNDQHWRGGPVEIGLHPETLRRIEAHVSASEWAELVESDTVLVADDQLDCAAVLVKTEQGAFWVDPARELQWLLESLWAELRGAGE